MSLHRLKRNLEKQTQKAKNLQEELDRIVYDKKKHREADARVGSLTKELETRKADNKQLNSQISLLKKRLSELENDESATIKKERAVAKSPVS